MYRQTMHRQLFILQSCRTVEQKKKNRNRPATKHADQISTEYTYESSKCVRISIGTCSRQGKELRLQVASSRCRFGIAPANLASPARCRPAGCWPTEPSRRRIPGRGRLNRVRAPFPVLNQGQDLGLRHVFDPVRTHKGLTTCQEGWPLGTGRRSFKNGLFILIPVSFILP